MNQREEEKYYKYIEEKQPNGQKLITNRKGQKKKQPKTFFLQKTESEK